MNHSAARANDGLAALICRCALVASTLVVAMVVAFAVTGIGQDPLQFMHPPAEYTAILLRNPPVLKLVIGLDNVFILFYSTMFLAWYAALWREGASRLLVVAGGALVTCAGMLDLVENMHFLAFLAMAQQAIPLEAGQIAGQVWESLIKFHVSYLGLFMLGVALPGDTGPKRALGFLLRWVQWPVGMLIYVAPESLGRPLVFVRFTFFLVSLLLLALIYRSPASGSGGRV